jgi:argininosuccinate synthase
VSEKVVLAYSGGLDTTVAVRWLRDKKDLEVIAVGIDVGQAGDMEAITDRALKSGAVDAITVDAVDEFASDFVLPALQANALYQQKYPLVSALSRPLICKHLAAAARKHEASFVAHGCTGKGNDQVRFEVSLGALAPDLQVLAPIREWGMAREDAISYGLAEGLPIPVGPADPYSIDENLWGRTVECGVLEDPMVEAPDDIWERTADPATAPAVSYLEVGFERGVPVTLDGTRRSLAELIREVERVAGSYGIGRVDMIEDRVVGIKSREIYEVPGALALIMAHNDLEELTLERDLLRQKRLLEQKYAQLVYEGFWYSPLREAIDAFFATSAEYVTGVVRLRFDPGSVRVVGRKSTDSLYDYSIATYDKGDQFDHASAEGFVKLWGLPLKIWARTRRK